MSPAISTAASAISATAASSVSSAATIPTAATSSISATALRSVPAVSSVPAAATVPIPVSSLVSAPAALCSAVLVLPETISTITHDQFPFQHIFLANIPYRLFAYYNLCCPSETATSAIFCPKLRLSPHWIHSICCSFLFSKYFLFNWHVSVPGRHLSASSLYRSAVFHSPSLS